MRLDGGWALTESRGDALQVALYVRDSLGIAGDGPDPVPPLMPAVHATRRAGPADVRAWHIWFARLLADECTGAPADPLGQLLAAGPTPPLGSAACELFDAARAWCAERNRANAESFRGQTHYERVAVTRFVDEVTRSLGHLVAPFTLHLVTLPVAGRWEHRARPDLLLFSDGSRHDLARLHAVLDPVVRELARPF